MLIRDTDRLAPAFGMLEKNDILMKLDDKIISADGTIQLRSRGERVFFNVLVQSKFEKDRIRALVWRNREVVEIDIPLFEFRPFVVSTKELPAQYLMVGGLVFTVLSYPYFGDAYHSGDLELGHETRGDLKLYCRTDSKRKEIEEIVILSRVLADEVTTGYKDFRHLELKSFQDMPVTSLGALVQMIEADQTSEFFKFQFGGRRIILSAKEARERTPIIAARHLITKYYNLRAE